jgi:putative ABC transport system ATP-binding protein
MPQKFGLYEDLTIQENMNLYADLKELSADEKQKQFEWLLKFTGLAPFTERLAGRLSGGMKQKLGLGCTLLGNPELLLLDEPGVGVDPISRRELMKMVYSLRDRGITVLWSTSYLDEAEKFDNVLLLNNGKLIFNGNPQTLTAQMNNRVFQTAEDTQNPRRLLRQIMRENNKLVDAVISGRHVRIVLPSSGEKPNLKLEKVMPHFEDAVIDILGGAPMKPSEIAQQITLTNNDNYVIKAENLTKVYGKGSTEVRALDDVSFKVNKGEFVAIVGASGSGKSTLLHILGGVDRPTSGKVFINGEDIFSLNDEKLAIFRRRQVGLIYQFYNLIPILNAEENITLPLSLDNRKVDQEELDNLIKLLGLERRKKHLPNELSGGQQQRVSIGRALITHPTIVLADEPTGNLDSKSSDEIVALLKKSNKDYNQTIIMITHNMEIAKVADRIIKIEDGHIVKEV